MKKSRSLLSKPIKNIMQSEVPKVTKDKTVEEVRTILKEYSKTCESIDYIYVVEKNNRLIGVFSIKELFRSQPKTKVEKFMQTKVISVSPSTTNKALSHLALKHRIKSIPVIESEKLIGVIPPKEVFQILNKTLREETFTFAGIHKSHLEYENAAEIPLYKSVFHRIPWLIFGLIGIMITAYFIGTFEKILEKHIILAFFVPAIVYMSDALGTQIQTIFIRDLAVMGNELKMRKYLIKHGITNIVISTIISILMFATISLFWNQKYLALVISISAFSTLIITGFTAITITWGIKKLGGDPAIGGGPFATVVSDATSIIIYFLVATAML